MMRRSTLRWATAGVLGALVACAPAVAAPSALTPPVAAAAASHPGRTIGVIVQAAPGADAAALTEAAGGRVTLALPIINAVAASMPARAAAALAAAPGVKAVSLDAPVLRTDKGDNRDNRDAGDNLDRGGRSGDGLVRGRRGDEGDGKGLVPAYDYAIRADDAWRRGITGKGAGIAIVDTGIAGDLPDFQVSRRDGTSRVVANAVVGGGSSAGDGFGHGTHVAGLAAGNGTNDGRAPRRSTNWVGVAPEANLIAVKVSDDSGEVTLANVIAGLQFAVEHRADYNIKVINLSLSSTVAESPATDPLDAAVEIAWFNGITVVAAAGNRGSDADAVSYAPANDPYVITVGAVDDQGTKRIDDDAVTPWSSRGATQTGVAKPDVLAPGAHMVSTLAPGSAFASLCPDCVVEDRYFRIGGTSMAAAVVSGAVALIAQEHPDWSPDQVKGALVRTLRDKGAGGIVDVARAANRNGRDVANAGNTPNQILPAYDPSAANFDRFSWTRFSWTRFSWTRFSWTAATGPQQAGWTRFSWTCDCVAPGPGSEPAPSGGASPDRFSWTRFSWTRFSWTRFSWTASFTK
jgi:serine protease AprX